MAHTFYYSLVGCSLKKRKQHGHKFALDVVDKFHLLLVRHMEATHLKFASMDTAVVAGDKVSAVVNDFRGNERSLVLSTGPLNDFDESVYELVAERDRVVVEDLVIRA